MAEVVIIGIGNPYRGDDTAGWAVIDALEGKVKGSVDLFKTRGDAAELLDIFSRYSKVFLVDACLTRRLDPWIRINALEEPFPEENTQTSTHGLSVAQAIPFARNLNALPKKLIVYAISGRFFNIGDVMSSQVEKAVSQVVEKLLHEEDVSRCMNLI